jgi:DNA-binding response OmpR family regulator
VTLVVRRPTSAPKISPWRLARQHLGSRLTKRILIVDDEEAMGRLIKLNLEPDGHAVTLMTDTNAALAALDAGNTFDLYILDVNMPTSAPNGLSFARMLEFRGRKPLVIFITGDPGLAAHPEFNGRTVLAKPIDFDVLRRTVAAVP